MNGVPTIDGRDRAEVLRQLVATIPYYVPQWDTSDENTVGSAFLNLFSGIADTVIKRLDQTPDKHFLTFLNMLGLSVRPPQQSRVLLKFAVSEGTQQEVYVPAGTKATAAPTTAHEELIFEVEPGQGFMATPATLQKVYSVDSQVDIIREHSEELAAGSTTTLFAADGDNLQEHHLYIGHSDFLNNKGAAFIVLDLPGLRDLSWEYYGERVDQHGKALGDDPWPALDVVHDSVLSPQYDPREYLILMKPAGEMKTLRVNGNGIESGWIRCKMTPGDTRAFLTRVGNNKVALDIRPLPVGSGGGDGNKGVAPDAIFYNDFPLDIGHLNSKEGVRPFGDVPKPLDTFSIACNDVFSKKGTWITLNFTITNSEPARADPTAIPTLSWEYWNGSGWAVIQNVQDRSNGLRATPSGTYASVAFTCPDDVSKGRVGGQDGFWIRVRLLSGDYGKLNLKKLPDSTWQFEHTYVKEPVIHSISIISDPRLRIAEHVITLNNLEYRKMKGTLERGFEPFERFPDAKRAIYLGFNKPMRGGPINVLFALTERPPPTTFTPKVRWEFCDAAGTWSKLEPYDETAHLTKKGLVRFVIPEGMSSTTTFGETLYWIRGRFLNEQSDQQALGRGSTTEKANKNDSDPLDHPCEKSIVVDCPNGAASAWPPSLTALYVNATWASHAETLQDEPLGSSEGTPNQQFIFSKHPVMGETVWVNELSALTADERRALVTTEPTAVKGVYDADGNATEFWVKWNRVDHFLSSSPGDRNYILDPTSGEISFGDGVAGRIPPIGTNNVRASYQTGGGKVGNVGAKEIASLKTSVQFIDGVTNPEPADGGADAESLDELKERGPQRLKNRGRAVMREDFEWLAKAASRKVARAKCMPHLGKDCAYSPGWVRVVIVPDSNEKRPTPSLELKQLVTRYLEQRAAGMLSSCGRLIVQEPAYLVISITGTLVAETVDVAPIIESEAASRLTAFLHPLTGGDSGTGWEFGRLPCAADFYQLLENVEGVDHVAELRVVVQTVREESKTAFTLSGQESFEVEPFCLVCSGEHDINVTYEG
ncbi:MAG: putative baseplate assembly protein [Halobacteriota archaeon]